MDGGPHVPLPSFDVTFGTLLECVGHLEVGSTERLPMWTLRFQSSAFFPLCVGSAMWALSLCPMRILDESLSLIGVHPHHEPTRGGTMWGGGGFGMGEFV